MKLTHIGIINFAKAVYSKIKLIVMREKLFVSEQVANKRLATCRTCIYKLDTVLGIQCQKCECLAEFKTKFRDESCPEGKW